MILRFTLRECANHFCLTGRHFPRRNTGFVPNACATTTDDATGTGTAPCRSCAGGSAGRNPHCSGHRSSRDASVRHHRTATGPVDREGVTAANGSVRLTNMRAGNYRLRFTREGSMTLERDVIMKGPMTVDVALSAGAAAPKIAEPVKPVAEPVSKTLPPPGEPKVTPVPLFLEKNFIGGREGRKDSSLGCTATGTATLHQIREAWLSHSHEDADEWIYVVAGEGTLADRHRRAAASGRHVQPDAAHHGPRARSAGAQSR